jgi:hypothetical protein
VVDPESITNDFPPGVPISWGEMGTGCHQLQAKSATFPELYQQAAQQPIIGAAPRDNANFPNHGRIFSSGP